jgi:hypothetical protein
MTRQVWTTSKCPARACSRLERTGRASPTGLVGLGRAGRPEFPAGPARPEPTVQSLQACLGRGAGTSSSRRLAASHAAGPARDLSRMASADAARAAAGDPGRARAPRFSCGCSLDSALEPRASRGRSLAGPGRGIEVISIERQARPARLRASGGRGTRGAGAERTANGGGQAAQLEGFEPSFVKGRSLCTVTVCVTAGAA